MLVKSTRLLRNLSARGVLVRIQWIPAHIGVPGNERADQLAKEATGWRKPVGSKPPEFVKPVKPLTKIYILRACRRRDIKRQVQKDWSSQWPQEEHGKDYRRDYSNTIEPATNALYAGMAKPLASILCQMRTAKIGLNGYLKRIKRIDTAACECHTSNQTVNYILGECPIYRRFRREFFGAPFIWDVKTILTSLVQASVAANFMLRTGLLLQFSNFRQKIILQVD